MQLPNVVPVLPDELYISYIKRLATENGLTEYQLLNLISPTTKYQLYNSIESPTFIGFLSEVVEAIMPHETINSILYKTSVLPIIYPISTIEIQNRYIQEVLNDTRLISKKISANYHYEFCTCEKCIQSDLQTYGYSYIHRIHQIPGVKCCPIHKVPLQSNTSINDADISYAKFCAELFVNPIPSNQRLIHSAIRTKMLELGYDNKYLSDELMENGYDSYFPNGPEYFISNFHPKSLYIPAESILAVLEFLFKTPQELMKYIPENDTSMQLILNHCDSCERDYLSTKQMLESGYICPHCSSEEALFTSLIEHKNNGQFNQITKYKGLSNDVKIKCKNCGSFIKKEARKFIYENVECNCNHYLTTKSLQAKLPGGYKIISFESEKTECVKVKALKCGHEFTVRYQKLIHFPGCRICKQKHESEFGFKASIKELVGNDYKLVSPYVDRTHKVSLLHKCGVVLEVAPKHFLNGQRCKCCTPALSKIDYSKYIKQLSSGRYEVIEFQTQNMVKLFDTDTSNEIVLHKQLILQELMRPTPSEILPHTILNPIPEAIFKPKEIVKSYIQNNYRVNEIIRLSALHTCLDDIPYSQLKHSINALLKENFIQRIETGKYIIAERK